MAFKKHRLVNKAVNNRRLYRRFSKALYTCQTKSVSALQIFLPMSIAMHCRRFTAWWIFSVFVQPEIFTSLLSWKIFSLGTDFFSFFPFSPLKMGTSGLLISQWSLLHLFFCRECICLIYTFLYFLSPILSSLIVCLMFLGLRICGDSWMCGFGFH